MSLLIRYADTDAERVLLRTNAHAEIARALAQVGVRFERWNCGAALPEAASADDILSAYGSDIARLQSEGGYLSADVVRLRRAPEDPEWPARARAAREKFLEEHTHGEDEVRFFVEGAGLFVLHGAGFVQLVLCEQGDLISVPARMPHWFDMGSDPSFCAIRLFGSPDGWVATFSGESIARRYPGYDDVVNQ